MLKKTIVEGLELKAAFDSRTVPPSKVNFMGTKFNIPISSSIWSEHILLTGGIGCGKTNAMFQIVNQIISNMTNDDVIIIFDSKGDFLKEFKSKCRVPPLIISNDSQCNTFWNMINETLVDGDAYVDDNIMELATSLFSESIEKDTSNPFFPLAARNVFYAILLAMYKINEAVHKRSKKYINNSSIYAATKMKTDDIVDLILDDRCKRYTEQMIEYLGRMESVDPFGEEPPQFQQNDQGASVLATLRNVAINIFKGNFAKQGEFSIREFVRNKGGKVLFIEYDVNQGRVLGPIYKTLVDLAIKETLGRHSSGSTYFIMDEFRLIPKLDFMDSGVNMGRSMGAKFMVAMQNVQQIEAVYGESDARSILSGFETNINFRTTDQKTREMIKERSGKCRFSYDVQSLAGGKQYEVDDVITDYDILHLEIGECILNIPSLDKNPINFRFKPYRS